VVVEDVDVEVDVVELDVLVEELVLVDVLELVLVLLVVVVGVPPAWPASGTSSQPKNPPVTAPLDVPSTSLTSPPAATGMSPPDSVSPFDPFTGTAHATIVRPTASCCTSAVILTMPAPDGPPPETDAETMWSRRPAGTV